MYSHRFVCEEPQERYEVPQANNWREEVETQNSSIEGNQKCNEDDQLVYPQVTFHLVGTVEHVEKCYCCCNVHTVYKCQTG